LLAWMLARRGHFVADRRSRQRLPRILAASLVMGVVVGGLALLLPEAAGSAMRALQAALLIGTGAVAYLGAGVALRAFNVREVIGMLRRRSRVAAAP